MAATAFSAAASARTGAPQTSSACTGRRGTRVRQSEESLPAVLTFPQFPLCLCSVIWPHRPAYRRHENYSRRARLPAPNPACWPNHLQTPWLQTLGTAPLCSWTKCTSCTSPWCRCELGGQCKMRCCTRGHSLSACGKFASGVRCHAARQTAALRCLPAPP